MGRPTPNALLPLAVFLLLLLLSLLPAAAAAAAVAAAAPGNRRPGSHLQVLTNFECLTEVSGHLLKPRCRWKLQENLSMPVPTFAVSTAELCQYEYQACVRVRLALNATGIRGLELHFLVLNNNRFASLRILRRDKHWDNSGTLWQVQFNCFPAMRGQKVLVSLTTIPPGALALRKSCFVPNRQSEPKFSYQWLPEARVIEVSVSEDSAITVRLCHQLALECEELHRPFHQEVLVSRNHTAVLPYELLLPCLCIEAYKRYDGLRRKVCPFQDQPEAYGPELWSSMDFQDYSRSDRAEMAMSLSGRCPLPPTASLCWKESAAPEAVCQDIPNSTFKRLNQEYLLKEVDVHPQLCFKFSYTNNSHVECPNRTNTAWNVSLSLTFLHFHLNFHSRIPASFSAALCQQQSLNHCELKPPVYTITHTERLGPENLELILPWHAMRSCILVWRSDVRFAGKQLLCPDVSRRHWGLLASGLGLGLGMLVAVILLIRWNLHRLRQGTPKKHHSHPILLIYSPDSEEYKQMVCTFAALLRSALGCPVLLDLWEMARVGRQGILPWMYAQRERVGQEQGHVLLLWSPGSARAYGLWQGQVNRDSRKAPEPHDLFGAAMACLQGDLQDASKQQNWVIAYFGKLCGQRDIPHALRFISRYCLPKELPGLVKVLQGPSSVVPTWLHTSAKALVVHLLKAEKKKDSRSRLYQTWRATTERLASPLTPLAHSKQCKPDCT